MLTEVGVLSHYRPKKIGHNLQSRDCMETGKICHG